MAGNNKKCPTKTEYDRRKWTLSDIFGKLGTQQKKGETTHP